LARAKSCAGSLAAASLCLSMVRSLLLQINPRASARGILSKSKWT
jgi:hypothetical protein